VSPGCCSLMRKVGGLRLVTTKGGLTRLIVFGWRGPFAEVKPDSNAETSIIAISVDVAALRCSTVCDPSIGARLPALGGKTVGEGPDGCYTFVDI
jgi:hypothetical protein